jgi:hypothetical protein
MSIRVIVRTGQSVFFFSSKMDLRTGGVAQVVELLPCKPEAVSSNPNTAKTKTIYIYCFVGGVVQVVRVPG